MIEDYDKLFKNLKSPELPGGLFDKIVDRINAEHRLTIIKQKVAVFSIGLALSIAGFVPAIKMVQKGFVESGFADFWSLIFSDAGVVLSDWQNFMLALVEKLPIMGIVFLLVIVLAFLEMLKSFVKNVKQIKFQHN